MDNVQIFRDYEADFYHYMVSYGKIASKTSRDYISRLRFLSQYYTIDNQITKEYIDQIIESENSRKNSRQKYSNAKAMSDFRSGLNKFHSFITSAYDKNLSDAINAEIERIDKNTSLTMTERSSIIQSRIGQGSFRSSLIRYWNGCSITNCSMMQILVASHIKPWCDCNNTQRLDMYNGLLLLPNFDKLFDKGYITFNLKGKLVCSNLLDREVRELLGITQNLQLRKLEERHIEYLRYHNEYRFMG